MFAASAWRAPHCSPQYSALLLLAVARRLLFYVTGLWTCFVRSEHALTDGWGSREDRCRSRLLAVWRCAQAGAKPPGELFKSRTSAVANPKRQATFLTNYTHSCDSVLYIPPLLPSVERNLEKQKSELSLTSR